MDLSEYSYLDKAKQVRKTMKKKYENCQMPEFVLNIHEGLTVSSLYAITSVEKVQLDFKQKMHLLASNKTDLLDT